MCLIIELTRRILILSLFLPRESSFWSRIVCWTENKPALSLSKILLHSEWNFEFCRWKLLSLSSKYNIMTSQESPEVSKKLILMPYAPSVKDNNRCDVQFYTIHNILSSPFLKIFRDFKQDYIILFWDSSVNMAGYL